MTIDLSELKNTPKVSFIIPTNKDRDDTIRTNICKLAGKYADIVFVRNPKNISIALDEGMERAKYDICVFMHDDVELRWPDGWAEMLKKQFAQERIGFVGVAGAKGVLDNGIWFEGLHEGTASHLLGRVWHGWFDKEGKYDEAATEFGPYGAAVVLDGVCLITTKQVLKDIGGFSKEIFGDFHFYDVSATIRATLAGYINVVVPLPVCHMSPGTFDDKWEEARIKFTETYADRLPLIANPAPCPVNYGNKPLRIFGFMPAGDGCSYYRVKQPLTIIDKAGLAMTRYYNQDETSKFDEEAHEVVTNTDVFLVRNGWTVWAKKILLNYDCRHKKFIFDSDDYDFKTSPYNPFYKGIGVEDYWDIDPKTGEEIPIWIDEDSPDREEIERRWPKTARYYPKKKNLRKQDEYKWNLKNTDVITVTTAELGEKYKEYNPNIVVVPNAIDFNLWFRLPLVKNDSEIRICWMGGSSHWEDLQLIRSWLPKFLKKNKNCKLIIAGQVPAKWIDEEIGKNQVEWHPWVTSSAHPYRMACLRADIALIPLKSNEFNDGKSPIKFCEWGALGIPSLVSYATPYKQITTDGNNALVFSTKDEFLSKLELLIKDRRYRDRIGNNAYNYVFENFNAEKIAKKQVEIYEKIYYHY